MSATAIRAPSALARTQAMRLVRSSSVKARTASTLETFASSRRSRSRPSPFSTTVRFRVSATSSARARLRSITLSRMRRGSASSFSATLRPMLPPPTTRARATSRWALPKTSMVRGTSGVATSR